MTNAQELLDSVVAVPPHSRLQLREESSTFRSLEFTRPMRALVDVDSSSEIQETSMGLKN